MRNLLGASNKLNEYAACGKPCLVPNSQDYIEFLGCNKIGIALDPGEFTAAAHGINEVLSNNLLYNELSKNSLEYFRSKGSFDIQFKPILNMCLT